LTYYINNDILCSLAANVNFMLCRRATPLPTLPFNWETTYDAIRSSPNGLWLTRLKFTVELKTTWQAIHLLRRELLKKGPG
jgi:hypothetical protein